MFQFLRSQLWYELHIGYLDKSGGICGLRTILRQSIHSPNLDEAKQFGLARAKEVLKEKKLPPDTRVFISITPRRRILMTEVAYPAKAWRIKERISTAGQVVDLTRPELAYELIYQNRKAA